MNAQKLKVNMTCRGLFNKMYEDVSVQFSNDQGKETTVSITKFEKKKKQ